MDHLQGQISLVHFHSKTEFDGGERNIQLQKSAPSKAEKRVKWYPQNQSMEEPIDSRYAAAVAAAAIAIGSHDLRKKSPPKESQPAKAQSSFSKSKSRKEGSMGRWFTIKEDDKEGVTPAGIDQSTPQSEKEKSKETIKSTTPRPGDVWEQAKTAKIRKRHEKTHKTILEWEKEKKQKLRKKLDIKEAQLDMRRKVALQRYRDEVTRIEKIAKGARRVADEKKRYDERKVMEKANQIRSMGRVNCLWF